jgi:nicotinamide phosphoribosyltransferase
MSSLESAILSGMGHLLSFTGTDTIPAIMALEKYYGADSDNELIGGSVPATEHSVMCSGSKDCEIDTIRRLITEVYPTGIVSIVSDTWDLWKVLTEYLPALKTEIMSRDGKVVARPDSGDPVDILCGTLPSPDGEWYFVPKRGGVPEYGKQTSDFGVIELLWNVFGGKTNEKGFKMLDPHVGAIYGDSITLERENDIYERLKAKGFASQVVLGIGSYTYQYNTRDTFGLAMKATYVQIDGKGRAIFKTPVTDDGTKNSATGLLRVESDFTLKENVTEEEEMGGALQTVFEDGVVMRQQNLKGIRKLLWG